MGPVSSGILVSRQELGFSIATGISRWPITLATNPTVKSHLLSGQAR